MQPSRPAVSTATEHRAPAPSVAPVRTPPPVPLPRRPLPYGLLVFGLLIVGAVGVVVGTDIGKMARAQVNAKLNELFPATTPPPPPGAAPQDIVAFGFIDLEQRIVPLVPEQPGRIAALQVREGQTVEKNAVLLEIDAAQADLAIQAADAAVKNAEIRLAQLKALPKQIEAEIRAQDTSITAHKSDREAAESALALARRNRDQGLIKQEMLDIAEAVASKTRQTVKAEEEKREMLTLKMEQTAFDTRRAENELLARQIQLAQAKDARDRYVLKAPERGKILRLHVSVGEVLLTGRKEPVLEFCPDKEFVVRAEVQQEVATDIFRGQVVEVEDDLRRAPRPKWAGKVKDYSGWFSLRREPIREPRQLNDVRTMECIITLDEAKKLQESDTIRLNQRVRVFFKKKEEAKPPE